MTTNPVMTITDEMLAELEAAADSATPGGWYQLKGTGQVFGVECGKALVVAQTQQVAAWSDWQENAAHIALNNPATTKALLRHIAELKERCAAAEKDAERYAWIRDQHNDGMGSTWVSVFQPGEGWVSLDTFVSGAKEDVLNLDDAVDAAIQSQGETK